MMQNTRHLQEQSEPRQRPHSTRRMATSLSGQMIVFETLFACVYGFLFSQRVPGLMEVTSIVLLVGRVVWAAKRHRIVPVKHAEP